MGENRIGKFTLDEFPYLVGGNPALPSIVQKFWDSKVAETGALKIVPCGSLIAQMEELLAERIPRNLQSAPKVASAQRITASMPSTGKLG
jgi:hypothetical protein